MQLLQQVDAYVSQIDEHPSDWTLEDLDRHLVLSGKHLSCSWLAFSSITLRRLRERFGEDGIQRINDLLERKTRNQSVVDTTPGLT